MPLSLYVDECVDARVTKGLRLRAVDLVSVHELGSLGASDEVHFARAIELGRVIVTADYNFLGLVSGRIQAGDTCPGMIFIESNVGVGQAIQGITDIATLLEPADMVSHIERVTRTAAP